MVSSRRKCSWGSCSCQLVPPKIRSKSSLNVGDSDSKPGNSQSCVISLFLSRSNQLWIPWRRLHYQRLRRFSRYPLRFFRTECLFGPREMLQLKVFEEVPPCDLIISRSQFLKLVSLGSHKALDGFASSVAAEIYTFPWYSSDSKSLEWNR